MRILSIDTTSRLGSVALSEDGRLLAQEQQGVPGTHSERLMVSIDHLLSLSGWGRADIEGIAVATGPGSFTGLRIGLGTAKGIALAAGCPIVGVSSLKSLALNGSNFRGTIVTLIDARRGEIYAAAWKFSGRRLSPKLKECVLPPAALIAKLRKIKGELLLVGDGVLEYGKIFKKGLGKSARIGEGTSCFPNAMNLATLALPKFRSKKTDNLVSLIPNYVRKSDAEIGFLPARCASQRGKRKAK